MQFRSRIALLALALATGCGGSSPAVNPARTSAAPTGPSAAPPLTDVIRAFDTRTGALVTLDALLDDAVDADAVFVGESHVDETTHRVELAIYDGLLARRDGKVVLALEMFSRDAQEHLDRYVAGELDEAAFVVAAKVWNNYTTGYRALVERARRDRLPVIGSNAPGSVIRAVAMGGGKAGYESLAADQRPFVAPELLPNSDSYWERFARVVRGHTGHTPDDPDQAAEQRLYSTQSLWDNTMGYSCAEALDRHPGSAVMHVNGSFHSNYREGTVEQFLARRPGARAVTVTLVMTDDLARAGVGKDEKIADYVIYVDARAHGPDQGWHGVRIGGDLRYRVHIPKTATDGARVPLLIWLAEEGTRADDVASYWKLALGDDAAIAVVEAPYRETQEQLFVAGRWYWTDTFEHDTSAVINAIERIARYVGRNYPVDDSRIVVAGAGASATVMAAFALYADRGLPAYAFAPDRFRKLGEAGLPFAAPPGSLRVFPTPAARAWWEGEVAQYRDIGLDATAADYEGTAATPAILRRALGLGEAATSPAAAPTRLAIADDSPLAALWAEQYRLALARAGTDATVVSAAEAGDQAAQALMLAGEAPELLPGAARIGADRFADGRALPLAPGGFGGTTVVVLPRGISDADRDAWIALESANVFAKRSRFSHLRVAVLDGEPSLPTVLQQIRDAHRSNVLIVPAVFCAPADAMRALRAAAGSLDGLTVAWLPGLGGRLYQTLLPEEPPR